MNKSTNTAVREHAKEKGVTFYELAAFMGLHESVFSRQYMRNELNTTEQINLIKNIDKIAASRE